MRSARAHDDLIEICLSIARDDPGAADRMLEAIATRWSQFAEHLLSGLARDDNQPRLRPLVAGRHLIREHLETATIRIVLVLHGRRRIAATDVASTSDDP